MSVDFVTQGNGSDAGFVTQGPYAVRWHPLLPHVHEREYNLVHMLGKEISRNVDLSNMHPLLPLGMRGRSMALTPTSR